MNKLIVTLFLTLLAFSLSAQMGLFELSFGDRREAAEANMIGQGFTKDWQNSYTSTMRLADAHYIDNVELYFSESDSTLVQWFVHYIPQEDEDIEYIAVDAVISWHGADYDYDDLREEYYWSLDEDHYVTAHYLVNDLYFTVEYVGPKAKY